MHEHHKSNHIADVFRTDPVGFLVTGVNGAFVVAEATKAIESSSTAEKILWFGLAALHTMLPIHEVRGHIMPAFEVRNRLELDIQKYGYNDRLFAATTTEYCTRQVARVVCAQYGVLAQYERLCDEHVDTMRYRWLPHI